MCINTQHEAMATMSIFEHRPDLVPVILRLMTVLGTAFAAHVEGLKTLVAAAGATGALS